MRQENAHKIKLVKILEILRQDSDEENYIGTTELLAKLAALGIVCDRRTLAADIDVLNDYGYEVLCEKWMRFKHPGLLRPKRRRFL